MAFITIPSSLFAVGKAVVKNLFQLSKDNFDNHETRIASVEAVANKVIFWNGTVLGASFFSTASGVSFHRVQAAIDVTDAKITIFELGGVSSGTLEVDIQKSTSLDFTSSVSIFTTKPSIDFSTASDHDESINAVLDVSALTLAEGDYLRIDVTSKPGSVGKFFFYLIGEGA